MSRSHPWLPAAALALAAGACGEGLTAPDPGAIEVTSVTVGAPPDPDGYLLSIDGQGRPIGANATLTVSPVAPGDHRLELGGIAPNCALAGSNPRTVRVAGGQPTRITLEVGCLTERGSIAVFTATSGASPDLDGYAVALDDDPAQAIGMNAVLTLSAVAPGQHAVRLTGVAPNCAVPGENPRIVSVEIGASSEVTFEVGCHSTAPGALLVTSDRSGDPHVYRVEPDGSAIVDLTPDDDASGGDWSPDGTRIAFGSGRDGDQAIYLMNADGSNPVRLAAGGAPAWSPDGSRIAFVSSEGVSVMEADGSNPRVLAPGGAPAWSPDGTRIAFSRVGQCAADLCGVALYLMAADGSEVRRLTDSSNPFDRSFGPAWSPDGTRIAYARTCCFLGSDIGGLWAIDPDGGAPTRIYRGSVAGKPVWSPDGSALVFPAGQADGTTEVMVMPAGGGGAAVLASSPGAEYPTSWR